jgi:plastocyanin
MRLVPYAAMTLSLGIAVSCSESPPREVTLIARGMTFVLADEPDVPNPVIVLAAGQRVRLVLRNEAPGLLHDFRIPAWRVQVTQIRAGQTAEVTFTVPNQPGRYEYVCRPHAELMKGVVEVTP